VPEPRLDEQDRVALLTTIDEVLSAHWDPTQRARATDPDQVWTRLVDLGITELIAEPAAGGMGLPLSILVDVVRVTGRHLAPGPVLEEAYVRPWLAAHGGPGARALGSRLAVVDPGASYDWRVNLGTVSRTGATLSGTVRGIANAPAATTLLVIAAEPADGAESMYAVDVNAPGVQVEAAAGLDPGCAIGTVSLAGYRIDGPPILTGGEKIATLRAELTLLVAAELRGIAEATVESSRAYALSRHQFDRPIAAFQAIRHLLADMAAHSIALGNLVELTGAELSELASPGRSTLTGAERVEAAAIAKAYAATTALEICEQALQVHGGIGFVEEHPLHRYFKATLRRHGQYGAPAELHQRIGSATLSAPADG
jgi:alkylation response protein AidB-like acyl-CoA dehydrogenase